MLLVLGLFAMIIMSAFYIANPSDENFDGLIVSGVVTATIMAGVGNVDGNPANDQRVGMQIKAKVWLISEDQWDEAQGFPAKINRERANIPLLAGEYWHYIKTVKNSVELKWVGEEGEIASNINKDLTLVTGGVGDDIFDLLEDGIGQGFFMVVEFCGTGNKYLLGSGCKPMILSSFDGGPTKDNTSTLITFKNVTGEIISKYTGNTPTQDPETVAADAATITLTDNPRYQLTDGTVAVVPITSFTSVDSSDVGRVVTLLGSGGTYPSEITDANDFILEGGVTWSAALGKQISFKIFKDGGATYKFIEVAGSRT